MAAITPTNWMSGVPIKLIRKEQLVSASEGDCNSDRLDRLPVYTLTFEIPTGHQFSGRAQPFEDVRIDMGEVVKMVIPVSHSNACFHNFFVSIRQRTV